MAVLPAILTCLAAWSPPPASPEALPSPQRQASNLVALAELHRFVRLHYPSRTAADIHWTERLLEAIPPVRAAHDQATLAQSLRQFVEGTGPPEVIIHTEAEQPAAELFRTAPVVESHGKVLYAALSSGDCCRPTIEYIEEHAKRQSFDFWILDLRHTRTRSFGSAFTEAKVTLAWTICGPITQPPRMGRDLTGWHFNEGDEARQINFALRPALTAEGPDLLADVPLLILVDETTHPAVGGWVLAAQVTSRAMVVGSPIAIQAEKPMEWEQTEELRASMPLSVYADPKGNPLVNGKLRPDIEMHLPPDAGPAETIQLLSGLTAPKRAVGKSECDPTVDLMSAELFTIQTAPLTDRQSAGADVSGRYPKSVVAIADLIIAHAFSEPDSHPVAPESTKMATLRDLIRARLELDER